MPHFSRSFKFLILLKHVHSSCCHFPSSNVLYLVLHKYILSCNRITTISVDYRTFVVVRTLHSILKIDRTHTIIWISYYVLFKWKLIQKIFEQAGAKKRRADHNKTKMVYTVLNSGSFDFSRPELSW